MAACGRLAVVGLRGWGPLGLRGRRGWSAAGTAGAARGIVAAAPALRGDRGAASYDRGRGSRNGDNRRRDEDERHRDDRRGDDRRGGGDDRRFRSASPFPGAPPPPAWPAPAVSESVRRTSTWDRPAAAGSDEPEYSGRTEGQRLSKVLVDPARDAISVNGQLLPRAPTELFYFALNKPRGFICSAGGSGAGGPTARLVGELMQPFLDEWVSAASAKLPAGVAPLPPRLFTVGRLDAMATGLLLMTNDGQWAQRVAHPSSGVTKEYVVNCDAAPTRRQLELVAAGTSVEGVAVAPTRVQQLDALGEGRKQLRVEVAEGRYHEVRSLVEAAGLAVLRLKRVRIGGLRMPRELPLGNYWRLGPRELAQVHDRAAQDASWE